MTYRPYPKYASRDAHAGPLTTCSTCGLLWNGSDMGFQYDFRGGSSPINTQILRCPRCFDSLAYQQKLLIIPPDPPTFYNVRPEPYSVDEANWLTTNEQQIILTEADEPITTNIPNPADSVASVLACRISAPGVSVAVCYLDLFIGAPSQGGRSVLADITGSSTRTNIASALTTAGGIATNPDYIVVSSASAAQTNVTFVGIYDAATGGTLLMEGAVSASPTIGLGNPVQFNQLGLYITL